MTKQPKRKIQMSDRPVLRAIQGVFSLAFNLVKWALILAVVWAAASVAFSVYKRATNQCHTEIKTEFLFKTDWLCRGVPAPAEPVQ